MELETQTVIDIEARSIGSEKEELIGQWYPTQSAMNTTRLSKADLQKSIRKLQDIYGLNLASLRRGAARATEYSQLALDATKLLNTGKLTQLRQLIEALPAATSATVGASLVISEYTSALDCKISQLGQNAASTAVSLNQSVIEILEQIAVENQASRQRRTDLRQIQINAAHNRGTAQALDIFRAEQEAQNEVLAQLRAMQIGGNQ